MQHHGIPETLISWVLFILNQLTVRVLTWILVQDSWLQKIKHGLMEFSWRRSIFWTVMWRNASLCHEERSSGRLWETLWPSLGRSTSDFKVKAILKVWTETRFLYKFLFNWVQSVYDCYILWYIYIYEHYSFTKVSRYSREITDVVPAFAKPLMARIMLVFSWL